MNPHIELVKKWLTDNEPVSLEELEANKTKAYVSFTAADAAYEAADAAYATYCYEAECYKKITIKSVEEYEELTREQGE